MRVGQSLFGPVRILFECLDMWQDMESGGHEEQSAI